MQKKKKVHQRVHHYTLSTIQGFDAFKTGAWEHTYALMLVTGTGLAIYKRLW